ncbi:MAG TPA: discoidin domain-containing protein [Polyangiaceae bacterium]|nr:discoidin domain-containing protein [Polyangiaceae bacterium]
MGSALWFFVAVLLFAGCNRERQHAGLAKGGAVARTGTGSRASSVSSLPAPSEASATSEVVHSVELLHRTASVVVTSSHADGNSTGAYLVDELAETSWKPNPPDQAPWIEVDLPAPATIERIEVTPALASSALPEASLLTGSVVVADPKEGWKDWATRRSRGAHGALLLEPDSATPVMRLRLSLSGVPRGLRLAELRVVGGIAGNELLTSAIPETQVQGNARLDYTGTFFAAWVLGAPYDTEDALCQAFIRLSGSEASSELCRKLPEVTVAGSAPAEVLGVQRYRLMVPNENGATETTALVVHAERGLFPANVALADNRNEGMCPGGPEGEMSASGFRFEQGVLLIDRTRYFTPGLMTTTPNAARSVAAASVLRCRFDDRLSCREVITRFGTPKMSLTDDGVVSYKLPQTWDWTRSVTASRRGSLRFTPCLAPAGKAPEPRIVPCATPGAELL